MSINKPLFCKYDIRRVHQTELNERSVKLKRYSFGKKVQGDKILASSYAAKSYSIELVNYLLSGLNASGCTVLDIEMVAPLVNYYANFISLKNYS